MPKLDKSAARAGLGWSSKHERRIFEVFPLEGSSPRLDPEALGPLAEELGRTPHAIHQRWQLVSRMAKKGSGPYPQVETLETTPKEEDQGIVALIEKVVGQLISLEARVTALEGTEPEKVPATPEEKLTLLGEFLERLNG